MNARLSYTRFLLFVAAVAASLDRKLPVLVLGNGGLIGRPLVHTLKAGGYGVLEVTGRSDLDLSTPGALRDRYSNVEIGFVFFLAWDVGGSGYIFGSENSQVKQLRSNTALILHTVSWLEERNLPFIYTGSALEIDTSGKKLTAYTEVKRLCSAWTLRLPKARTVRFWNVYGPVLDTIKRVQENRGHVITDWVQKCFDGAAPDDNCEDCITIVHARTDGHEQRQMLFSIDAAKLLLRAMEHFSSLPYNKPIDVAAGRWTTLRDLSKSLVQVLGQLRQDDPSIPRCRFQFPPIPAEIARNSEPRLDTESSLLLYKGNKETSLGEGIAIIIQDHMENISRLRQNIEQISETAFTASNNPHSRPQVLIADIWSATKEAQEHAANNDIGTAESILIRAIGNVTATGLISGGEGGNSTRVDPALAHSALYNDLGVVLLRQERLEEAALSFTTAVWINPWNEASHRNLRYISEHGNVSVETESMVGNPFLFAPTHLKETALFNLQESINGENGIVYKPDALRLMSRALVQSSTANYSDYTVLSENFAVMVSETLSYIPNHGPLNNYAEIFICGLYHIRLARARKQPEFQNEAMYTWYESQVHQPRTQTANIDDAPDRYSDDLAACEFLLVNDINPGSVHARIVLEARLLSRMNLKREALELLEGHFSNHPEFLQSDASVATELAALRWVQGCQEHDLKQGENVFSTKERKERLVPVVKYATKGKGTLRTACQTIDTVIADYKEKTHSMFVVAVVNKNIGLGNRLLSLIGALAFAIATDRALVIQWPQEYRYGEPPSNMNELLTLSPELASMFDLGKLSNLTGLPIHQFPTFSSVIELFHDQEDHGANLRIFERLACEDLSSTRAGNETFLYLHTNQELTSILRYNRYLPWASHNETFSRLAKALIKPSLRVQQAAEAWLAAVTEGTEETSSDLNSEYLSVHIRAGIAGHDVVHGGVLTEEEVARSQNRTLVGAVKATGSVLKQIQHALNRTNDQNPSFVFVAADNRRIRSAAVTMIRDQFKIKTAAYDDSLIAENLRLGTKGLSLVAVDFFLLAGGQNVLRREFSTFSMVAGAVGGIIPYLYVPCNRDHVHFSVFRERHSAGRLGTNLDNLKHSPAICHGERGSLAQKMQLDGFLYPSCSEYIALP